MPVGMVPATLVLYENDKRPVEDDTSLFGAAAFYNNTAVTAAAFYNNTAVTAAAFYNNIAVTAAGFLPPMCDLDYYSIVPKFGRKAACGQLKQDIANILGTRSKPGTLFNTIYYKIKYLFPRNLLRSTPADCPAGTAPPIPAPDWDSRRARAAVLHRGSGRLLIFRRTGTDHFRL